MKTINMTIASATLMLASATTLAADDDRSGLLLGLGLGTSSINTSVEQVNSDATGSDAVDDRGGAFAFRIGGAVGKKSAVYLIGQASSTEAELGHSLTGIGASYYFSKSGTSLYVTGGYGLGIVSYADNDVPEGTGTAAMVGVGLELSWGLNLELNHMRVNTTPETTDDTTTEQVNAGLNYDIASTQFMVGFTWF